MPEHYTRNTVSVQIWCSKCFKVTEHRVDGGRRGPCNVCIAKLNEDHEKRKDEKPTATQANLFGQQKSPSGGGA